MKKINNEKLYELDKQLDELEALLEDLELKAENAALFEAQLIEYMIDNDLYELKIGDTIISCEIDEILDIEKMKKDGIYEDFLIEAEGE